MSDLFSDNATCGAGSAFPCAAIRTILHPKDKDLGGFSVRRLLPAASIKSVGPFVFFDHLGPADFQPGSGMDVRPHPHIGLATITYLFAGEILHRDSLGHVQSIRPAEVNWMTAGRGISHSERTPSHLRQAGHSLHALQLWVALPDDLEQTDPTFTHYDADQIPVINREGNRLRVIIGAAWGAHSPVKASSPTLYAEAQVKQGAVLDLPDDIGERAIYVVDGRVQVQGVDIERHSMAVFEPLPKIEVSAIADSRLVIIGGQPLGKRTVWWNLVSTRKDLIEQAKEEWKTRRFPQVPGETEYIPLPGDR